MHKFLVCKVVVTRYISQEPKQNIDKRTSKWPRAAVEEAYHQLPEHAVGLVLEIYVRRSGLGWW